MRFFPKDLLKFSIFIILLSSFIASFIYLYSLGHLEKSHDYIPKSASIFLLVVFIALQKKKIINSLYLSIALLLSGAGDIFLTLNTNMGFIYGVWCFLGAHLFFIMTFFGYLEKPLSLSNFQKITIFFLVGYGLSTLAILNPYLPTSYYIPIYTYIVTLNCMIIVASLIPKFPNLVFIGAFCFGLSDSILGISTFIMPFSLDKYLIWIGYYSAQILIVFGIVKLNHFNEIALKKILMF